MYKWIVAKFIGNDKDKEFIKMGLIKNKKYLVKPIGVYLKEINKVVIDFTILRDGKPFMTFYDNAYDIYKDWKILSKVDYDSPFCPLKRPKIKGTIFTCGKIKIKEAK